MTTHCSILAWRIPRTESGGLESMGVTKSIQLCAQARERRAPAERLLWPGRASPSASQLLAFSPGKEQAAGVPRGHSHLHSIPDFS